MAGVYARYFVDLTYFGIWVYFFYWIYDLVAHKYNPKTAILRGKTCVSNIARYPNSSLISLHSLSLSPPPIRFKFSLFFNFSLFLNFSLQIGIYGKIKIIPTCANNVAQTSVNGRAVCRMWRLE